MALPASGPISFSDINAEIRRGSTATTSLGEAAVRTTADRAASNISISFSDLLGKTYGAATVFAAATGTTRAHAYRWSQGFGTKYSNPASLPNGSCYQVQANRKKTVVGFIQNTSTNRFMAFYPWSDSSGFGTRYTAPATYPLGSVISSLGNGTMTFSTDGNAVIVGSSSTAPTTQAWAWSDASGYGTKFSDPATSPPDAHALKLYNDYGGSNPPDDVVLFSAVSTDANRVSAWEFNSSTGWGAKKNAPASLPSSSAYSITSDIFSVIYGTQGTGERRSVAYEFDFFSGFGTRYSTMASTVILANPYSCQLSWIRTGSFSPVVTYAWARTTSGLAAPGFVTIDWGYNGWGSAYTSPAIGIPSADGNPNDTSFNLNIDVGIAHEGSPYMTIYPWSNGYGSKYADPSTLPDGYCIGMHMATSFS